jgi:hypothetical protein
MLPPFVNKKQEEEEAEKPKIDRLSKKKRIKKTPDTKKQLTSFKFAGK